MPSCESVKEFHVADANLQGLTRQAVRSPVQLFDSLLICQLIGLASQLTLPICPFDLQRPVKILLYLIGWILVTNGIATGTDENNQRQIYKVGAHEIFIPCVQQPIQILNLHLKAD